MLGERGTWGVYSDGQRRCLTLPNGPVRAGSCGSEYCRRQCGHILDLHSAKPPDFCKWLMSMQIIPVDLYLTSTVLVLRLQW